MVPPVLAYSTADCSCYMGTTSAHIFTTADLGAFLFIYLLFFFFFLRKEVIEKNIISILVKSKTAVLLSLHCISVHNGIKRFHPQKIQGIFSCNSFT